MAIVQTLEGMVIRNPELRDGRPIIAGTGVAVRTVVGYYKLGMTPEEIFDEMRIALLVRTMLWPIAISTVS